MVKSKIRMFFRSEAGKPLLLGGVSPIADTVEDIGAPIKAPIAGSSSYARDNLSSLLWISQPQKPVYSQLLSDALNNSYFEINTVGVTQLMLNRVIIDAPNKSVAYQAQQLLYSL